MILKAHESHMETFFNLKPTGWKFWKMQSQTLFKPQSEGGHYQLSESCSYRAILTQSLNTTRVIILDTAARVTLFLPFFLNQLLNLLVLPDTGGELGSQMDQVNLK